jgi:hypothetical protein
MALRYSGICSTPFSPVSLSTNTIMFAAASLLLATAVFAQQTPPVKPRDAAAASSKQPTVTKETTITVPAGTRLALVLTHPVNSKSTHRGDEIYAQTSAPATEGAQAVIPVGTFVQGQVQKLSRRGTRGEFVMQSVSLIFPNGYVASIPGPINIESDEETAYRNPGGRAKVLAIAAPLAGAGVGALIGSAAHTTQSMPFGGQTLTTSTPVGVGIGSMIGLATGGVVSLVLLTRSPQFFVDVGSTMQMILPHALVLSEKQLAKAGPSQAPVPLVTPPVPRPIFMPRNCGICSSPEPPRTPGTPGTPPMVIPGAPGTPPVVIPGTPPTPPQ